MELLEILDAEGHATGEVLDKEIVHKKGLYHKEVALLLVNDKGEILLQKRASTKDTQADKWAWHGGHVRSTETDIEAIIRETKEEIGLDLNTNELNILMTIKRDKLPNRQFTTVFLAKSNLQIEDFTIQKTELSEVRWFTLELFKTWIYENHPDMMFKMNPNTEKMLSSLERVIHGSQEDYISFPLNEHEELLKRLTNGKEIYTTRVSLEVNKYQNGEIYDSPFGKLKVVSKVHIDRLNSHPFLRELTSEQQKEIEKYIKENGADILGLIKVDQP